MEVSEYYVTHPSISLTALVKAPTTEKARTAFLDYLERSGMIARRSRQFYRENMIAERMNEDLPVRADIELSYGYVGSETDRYYDAEPVRFPAYGESHYEEPQHEELGEGGSNEEEPFAEPERGRRMSPIQQAATRGFIK